VDYGETQSENENSSGWQAVDGGPTSWLAVLEKLRVSWYSSCLRTYRLPLVVDYSLTQTSHLTCGSQQKIRKNFEHSEKITREYG
jgi:hypothetical protein